MNIYHKPQKHRALPLQNPSSAQHRPIDTHKSPGEPQTPGWGGYVRGGHTHTGPPTPTAGPWNRCPQLGPPRTAAPRAASRHPPPPPKSPGSPGHKATGARRPIPGVWSEDSPLPWFALSMAATQARPAAVTLSPRPPPVTQSAPRRPAQPASGEGRGESASPAASPWRRSHVSSSSSSSRRRRRCRFPERAARRG